ncbi:hypothetical protein NDU88_005901 [Pleurodeles waltl]|uniref:Uncharacterized protein n=1 Tax=Pleurodeles waltl TaxID=8319 RepID=A0AAV7TXX3_PLEWA|nr:hypothetical protein NDU88_005901 [Pleurodeles waltl]
MNTLGDECDGSTPSRSIPPYPWGTSAVVVPDPDADRSETYPHPLLGDVGLRKALLAAARERRGEEEVTDETRDIAVPKRTAALQEAAAAPGPPEALQKAVTLQEAAALQEAVAAPGPSAALQEVAALQEAVAAPRSPATLQKTAALQEAAAADGDTRTWCPTTVVSLPQQPLMGQEAEQPGIRPCSGKVCGTKVNLIFPMIGGRDRQLHNGFLKGKD